MVQLFLSAIFKHQVLQWDGVTVPMKEPSGLLGKSDLTSRKMCKVVMHTTEPVSTREATERLVKILNITYAKSYPKKLADNTTQKNAVERS